MLVSYTPISSLSPDQQARLKAICTGIHLEHGGAFMFEGKAISAADIGALQRMAANERAKPGQPLFG